MSFHTGIETDHLYPAIWGYLEDHAGVIPTLFGMSTPAWDVPGFPTGLEISHSASEVPGTAAVPLWDQSVLVFPTRGFATLANSGRPTDNSEESTKVDDLLVSSAEQPVNTLARVDRAAAKAKRQKRKASRAAAKAPLKQGRPWTFELLKFYLATRLESLVTLYSSRCCMFDANRLVCSIFHALPVEVPRWCDAKAADLAKSNRQIGSSLQALQRMALETGRGTLECQRPQSCPCRKWVKKSSRKGRSSDSTGVGQTPSKPTTAKSSGKTPQPREGR